MINKVKETIEKYKLINSDDKIVVGVSGGPDSLSLLHVLYSLGYKVVVAHINHGLRENGNLDEEFVKKFCKNLGIKFYCKKIDLKNKENFNGMSTEEAGRSARYAFFNEVLEIEKASKIATAHNLNDNVETVLLNEFRGSGVSGLKGIMPSSKNIIRPLIECTRKEIEDYCAENKLNPRHDESNDETLYTRNKIRLELIPYLEKNINTNVVNTISRLSQIVAEEEEFVNQEVAKGFELCIVKDVNNEVKEDENNNFQDVSDCDNASIVFNLKKFNSLHVLLRKRLILKAIYEVLGNAKDIEKVHIDDICKMCENNVGGKFLTPNKNVKVSVKNHKIFFEKIL